MMKLKEAFKLVDKKYHGNPAIIYQGNKTLLCCVFASMIEFANRYDYEVLDENKPYDIYVDGKTLIFRVR